MDNDTAIKTLDRYFSALKDQERDWGFFMGLVDYVNLLDEIPQIKAVVDQLFAPKQKFAKAMWEAETLAIEELHLISDQVLKIAKKTKTDAITSAVVALKKYDKGELNPSWWHSARLEHGIRDLVKAMQDAGARAQLNGIIPPEADYKGGL